MRGCFQIYTGNGKGKTTAAMGLILRAVGAGMRVYLGQFLKGGRSSEIRVLKERFPEVTVEAFGTGRLIRGKPSARDSKIACEGLEQLRCALKSGTYDIVVADEINVAVQMGVLTVDSVMGVVGERPGNVELIFTGRYAHKRVLSKADLVSKIVDVKHYFDHGMKARKGVEE